MNSLNNRNELVDLLDSYLEEQLSSCADMMINFYDDLPDDKKSLLIDRLLAGRLRQDIQERLLVHPLDPRDHFMVALSNLREDGDIEHLIRALNWMDDDIRLLSQEMSRLIGSDKAADKLRIEVARLKDSNNALREKNAQLREQLKQCKYGKKKF